MLNRIPDGYLAIDSSMVPPWPGVLEKKAFQFRKIKVIESIDEIAGKTYHHVSLSLINNKYPSLLDIYKVKEDFFQDHENVMMDLDVGRTIKNPKICHLWSK